jgi:hypothetical protein
MKTKFALVFGLLSVCLISGSAAAFGQRLYPVQGPAATQADPPVFTAKVTNYLGKSGIITLVQVNGESFQGPWSIVTATFYNDKTPGTPASYPPQPNLAFAWDAVYGEGYYVSTILGSENVGQAVATGDKGTVLQIEFHREQLGVPEDNHFGVAVDNKGNIYKVVL